MKEIWKPIKGFEGYYEVSNQGNIKSIERTVSNSFGLKKDRTIKGVSIKPIFRGNWYVKVHLRKKGKRYCFFLHRILAQTFLPNPENKPEVNHKDGNKLNYNLDNLEWVTKSENKLHAIKTGLRTITKGEERTTAILNDGKVRTIRQLYNTGNYYYRELAEIYGVSGKTIESVVKFRKWKHVA